MIAYDHVNIISRLDWMRCARQSRDVVLLAFYVGKILFDLFAWSFVYTCTYFLNLFLFWILTCKKWYKHTIYDGLKFYYGFKKWSNTRFNQGFRYKWVKQNWDKIFPWFRRSDAKYSDEDPDDNLDIWFCYIIFILSSKLFLSL